MDLYLKITKPSDFKHEQLKNQKTGELYSLSDLISQNIGSNQLFFHHDIIPPSLKSSGPHRHTIIEEVVYIIKGSVTVVTGDNQTVLNAGSVVYFDPNEKENHHIINHTDHNAETITFSISSEFDRVIYENSSVAIQRPESIFNNDLKEIPVDANKWELFLEDLKNQLKTETHPEKLLSLHEHIGMASQILFKLSEAEYYLMKAVSATYSYPKQSRLIQNLIRLAHVYQWKKEFHKAHLLFDQAKALLNKADLSESLKASFHQHLGKLYFDQSFYGLSLTEFEVALKIRQRIQAPDDQVSSTVLAIKETKKRLKDNGSIIIRRAEVKDAEAVHHAHMKSINEICSKDHSPDEIRVWGGRQYNPDFRIPAIQEQFYLVVESENKIEGFCQLKLNTNDQGIKTAHLYGLYITPKMLNKGIGFKLLNLALEFLKSENVKEVTLKSSITALEFYKKHGFVRHGEMSGMVRDGVKITGYPMRLLFEKSQMNYAPEIIETERLILRKINESDAQSIFAYCSDPAVAIHTTWEPHKNLDDSVKLVEYAKKNYQRGLCEPLAITLKSNPEILIGTVGWFWNSEKHKSIEIAYALSPKHWGKGIVVEACRSLVDYAVNNFEIHRITSRCRPENTASSRVMEKLGMKHEGIQKKLMFVKGQYIDLSNYCILKDEWKNNEFRS